jgi:hypothetical protein
LVLGFRTRQVEKVSTSLPATAFTLLPDRLCVQGLLTVPLSQMTPGEIRGPPQFARIAELVILQDVSTLELGATDSTSYLSIFQKIAGPICGPRLLRTANCAAFATELCGRSSRPHR